MHLSRRTWIQTATGTLAAATLPHHHAVAEAPPGDDFTVIAYNVYQCRGWPADRPQAREAKSAGEMPKRFAAALSPLNADVVVLSESPSESVTTSIAKRLNMHVIRFPSGRHWPGTLLSRWEILDSANAPVRGGTRPPDLFTRHWGRATLRRPDGSVLIVHSAHLMPGPDPAVRIREINAMLESMKPDLDAGRDLLLLGDLNHGPDTTEYQMWVDAGLVDTWKRVGQGDGLTFKSDIPKYRIDYVFAAGSITDRIVKSEPLFTTPFRLESDDETAFALSDHLPQLATFKLAR
ncbi:MAG: endonuclease/exonuclease/phosphatase family protein [Novipirellula sp. JB048]